MPAGPLRLTRRGRVVIVLLATGLLLAIFSLGRLSAGAAQPAGPSRTVTVQAGDTLWGIANQVAPGKDTRATVQRLKSLNHLSSGALQVGQSLVLP